MARGLQLERGGACGAQAAHGAARRPPPPPPVRPSLRPLHAKTKCRLFTKPKPAFRSCRAWCSAGTAVIRLQKQVLISDAEWPYPSGTEAWSSGGNPTKTSFGILREKNAKTCSSTSAGLPSSLLRSFARLEFDFRASSPRSFRYSPEQIPPRLHQRPGTRLFTRDYPIVKPASSSSGVRPSTPTPRCVCACP